MLDFWLDDPVAAKGGLAAVALAVLWCVEGLVPMFEGRERRTQHGAANLALGIGNALLVSLLFAGATLFVTEWARVRGVGALHALRMTPGWSTVAAVVLMDLWQYAWHRLNHGVPLLWRFHAVHHSDRDLDATTGFRFHTGEIALSAFARLVVLPVLGLTIPQVLVYELVLLPVVLFHHSNVRLPASVDRWLRLFIVTPRMHWVHHSEYQPETDSNYSSVFSIWDRLFRSFRLRSDPAGIRLGLAGVERDSWATLRGMLWMPFRRPPDESSVSLEGPDGLDAGSPSRGDVDREDSDGQ